MSEIRNLIFDFDGTLADTSKLIVATMQKTIIDCGLPFLTEDEIKATIGVRLEEIPSILWSDHKNLGELVSSVYRKNFEIFKDEIPVVLFPGVKETLETLKDNGLHMAIATSRSRRSAEELTENLGIRNYFDYLLGGNDVAEGKPNPESVFTIMERLKWKQDETMMIGDMKVDILMGKNAGVRTCGVTYGNGKESELLETSPDHIISSFSQLPSVL